MVSLAADSLVLQISMSYVNILHCSSIVSMTAVIISSILYVHVFLFFLYNGIYLWRKIQQFTNSPHAGQGLRSTRG